MLNRPQAGLLLLLYVLYLLEPGTQDLLNTFSDAATKPRSFLNDRAVRTIVNEYVIPTKGSSSCIISRHHFTLDCCWVVSYTKIPPLPERHHHCEPFRQEFRYDSKAARVQISMFSAATSCRPALAFNATPWFR